MSDEAPKKEESRRKTRQSVQRAIELAEEEHRRGLMRRRIQLANQGLGDIAMPKFEQRLPRCLLLGLIGRSGRLGQQRNSRRPTNRPEGCDGGESHRRVLAHHHR